MAEATKTGIQKRSITGDLRWYGFDSIVFANNGDTFTTPLKHVEEISMTPTTTAAYGFTVATNSSGYQVLTLVSGGTVTFRGGVAGV